MIRQHAANNDKGFTLLEVMIALAIVSITLIAMLGLTQRNILVNDRLQQMTRATILAKQKMAEIENGILSSLDRSQGEFSSPNQQFSWQAQYSSTPIPGIQQIDLSVVWGEEKNNELVTLTSFLPENPR